MSPFLKQLWVASGVLLNTYGQALVMTFPYCLLPALRAPDSPIKVDLDIASWLASSTITSSFGAIVSTIIMEMLGRRLGHILMAIPSITGCILIYFSSDVMTLMAGRMIGSIGLPTSYTIATTVISEYTRPEYRGVLLGSKTAIISLGFTTMHIISEYYNWRTIALVSMIPFIISFCITFTWTESPYWLAKTRKYERSESSFFWLRGRDERSVKEIEILIRTQKESATNTNVKFNLCRRLVYYLRLLTKKAFVIPVVLIFVSFILLESCGRHAFPAFASDFIGSINGNFDAKCFLFVISIDLSNTICAALTALIMKFYRRRVVVLTSGTCSLLFLGSLCLYLFLVNREIISNGPPWIPLTVLFIYFSLTNLGCTILCKILLGELLPLTDKGFGIMLSVSLAYIPLSLFLKFTPFMLSAIDSYGTLAVYGLFTLFSLLLLYFYLPETKDRTLQEIEYFFHHGSYPVEGNENCTRLLCNL